MGLKLTKLSISSEVRISVSWLFKILRNAVSARSNQKFSISRRHSVKRKRSLPMKMQKKVLLVLRE